ncbi:MAG: redoxin domain-containing protein [Candidatus Eisenbacteria bacterium]|uniref:Redoxin domain-containing protein n=1 Tax=Eiseniibacteriota bacterium TaxID=2212470 RepID=A0A849SYL6_UNCEI|nr:redoxin domain-containing protein [Candidatus Eisenbacteria bacterium]
MLSNLLILSIVFALGADPVPGASRPPFERLPGAGTPSPRIQEPPHSLIEVGAAAPDFSYQTADGHWRHLRELLGHGPALLVFGANREQLLALEAERNALLDNGILPVAVLNEKPARIWSVVRDLSLNYTVLADPRQVVAEQFNVKREDQRSATPSWFVLNQQGEVRALRRGQLPNAGFNTLASTALGRPVPGAALPASH